MLYWMQASQRARTNHALEHAVRRANDHGLPLVVAFGLTDDFPEATWRHYRFMLEGLRETASDLQRRGIRLVVRRGSPDDVALGLTADAAEVVCDRGYLRHQRAWRRRLAEEAACRVVEVEADVVVPTDTVSSKREYAARTFRPRVQRHLDRFLVELRTTAVDRDSLDLELDGISLDDLDAVLEPMRIDRSVPPSPLFEGGTREAFRRLRRFVDERLRGSSELRSQPQLDATSGLSPYLHFGQISPLDVALAVRSAPAPRADRDTFLEELVVRRELAVNFVRHEPTYDRYGCLPDWARKTLEAHRDDSREHVYVRREIEDGQTHDRYFNAAMLEMRSTGFMHTYMRMYWGKKILEWTNTPEYAYRLILELNNRWFLDGRDPSSYANVGWIFGLHDRPWAERSVFGTVRYMSSGGLERKADPEAYIRKVDRLVEEAERHTG